MRKTIFAGARSGFAIQELGLRKRAVTRPLRLEFAGTVYHLPARVNARQKTFFNDAEPTEENRANELLMLDCKP